MDILIVVLAFVFLWKIQLKKGFNEEYLSISTCQEWRGFFALIIIFHHLSSRAVDEVFFGCFRGVGFLAVAIFFFLSGYGLQKRHITDSNYNKTFLKKRIPTILIPYIIITIVYWVVYALVGDIYSPMEILGLFIQGNPIVTYSWYVVNILLLYLSFYILMKVTKNYHNYMILGAALSYVIWICVFIKLSFGVWWYFSSHLFVVGIIWATYEQRIIKVITSNFNIVSLVVIIANLICFPLNYIIKDAVPYLIVKLITALFFTILVLMFSMKFQIGNKALNFIGRISFEIYLIHGLFVTLFGKDFFYIQNNLIYSISVLALTIGFSVVFHKLCKFVLAQYDKMLS